ncbi:MAG: helix-turn-helix domain-containing protein [Planctomycetes bacterium]|nr:helix-turn-helix domain-containing protein [Planctomycetota bacterium]
MTPAGIAFTIKRPLSLDALAEDPTRAAEVPAEEVPGILVRLAALQTALAANLAMPASAAPDRLLDAEEAATMLGASMDYLYRHAKKLPFTVRVGRRLRFSQKGIEKFIRQRQGA